MDDVFPAFQVTEGGAWSDTWSWRACCSESIMVFRRVAFGRPLFRGFWTQSARRRRSSLFIGILASLPIRHREERIRVRERKCRKRRSRNTVTQLFPPSVSWSNATTNQDWIESQCHPCYHHAKMLWPQHIWSVLSMDSYNLWNCATTTPCVCLVNILL